MLVGCHWLALQIQSLALSFIYFISAERHISIISRRIVTWREDGSTAQLLMILQSLLEKRLEFTVARKRDGTWISHVRKLSAVVNSSLRWDAHISPLIQWATYASLASIIISLHCEWAFAHSSNSQLPTHDFFRGNIILCSLLTIKHSSSVCISALQLQNLLCIRLEELWRYFNKPF